MGLVGESQLVMSTTSFPGNRTTPAEAHTNRGASLLCLSGYAGPMDRTAYEYTPQSRGPSLKVLDSMPMLATKTHPFYGGTVRAVWHWAEGVWQRDMEPPETYTIGETTYDVDRYRWRFLEWTKNVVGTIGVSVTCGGITVPSSGYAYTSPLCFQTLWLPETTKLEIEVSMTGPGGSTTPELLEMVGHFQFWVPAEVLF